MKARLTFQPKIGANRAEIALSKLPYRAALNPIEGGPYYILAYKPSVHYTMGGLHINTDAQVLDSDGAPIPGLFAAGEQAGHKMGTNRLGSCSITDVFVFGRVAGANAAALA